MKTAFWYDVFILRGGKCAHVKTDAFKAHSRVEFFEQLNRWNAQAQMFPNDTSRPRWLYVARL